jgi:hypothetical protein
MLSSPAQYSRWRAPAACVNDLVEESNVSFTHLQRLEAESIQIMGAVESEADTLPAIIQEMLLSRTSERQGRVIDHDSAASMEKKKQEGYF